MGKLRFREADFHHGRYSWNERDSAIAVSSQILV
jgi:hypothetical protein